MVVNVGVNGFGRIGRQIFNAIHDSEDAPYPSQRLLAYQAAATRARGQGDAREMRWAGVRLILMFRQDETGRMRAQRSW